ncbi:26S proteasome non-ATPase regulatory subunit [Lachnellula hyalina]|uniref:Probable 26S proteasome regulatory subunit p27 n=1 Tax=Lachnellula hyalina TaxID=1316788 RepID=A0A8H8U3L3_9HELO|nr:26S proteasome non-ATPase regulatory subunit [Lachnellula hyalina]TVY30417.1 26S proteasome non-ATPase regulatory subunit [Lachnellula hyalina]
MGLPLRMENLHAPTVHSGPTSGLAGTNGIQTSGLSLTQLQAKKDNIEAEIRALGSVLESHGVDMNTRLITPDGFPRADIDVAQIRTTRSRIIYLKNDYKALMNVIEKHIHEHFARQTELAATEATTNGSTPVDVDTSPYSSRVQQAAGPPFAKVNSVVDGSPADSAGLKAGDEIRNFGYVSHTNHDGLKRVGECVQGNEGASQNIQREILVKVSRSPASGAAQRQELQLTLTPRRDWGGRGLLGCHILPL